MIHSDKNRFGSTFSGDECFAQLFITAEQLRKELANLTTKLAPSDPFICQEILELASLDSRMLRLRLALLWSHNPHKRDAVLQQCQFVEEHQSKASLIHVWLDDPTFRERMEHVRHILSQGNDLSPQEFSGLMALVAEITMCLEPPMERTAYIVEQAFYQRLLDAFNE